MRQHIRRWFGVALWLVTVLGLCGWVGGSALPSLTSRDIAGPLCSAAASVGRTARPAPSQLLTVRAGPVDGLPGMPAVADPKNLYSATASRSSEPGGRRDTDPRLRAEPPIEQRLCDRSGYPHGGGSLAGRLQPAARRAVMGFEDPVGRQ